MEDWSGNRKGGFIMMELPSWELEQQMRHNTAKGRGRKEEAPNLVPDPGQSIFCQCLPLVKCVSKSVGKGAWEMYSPTEPERQHRKQANVHILSAEAREDSTNVHCIGMETTEHKDPTSTLQMSRQRLRQNLLTDKIQPERSQNPDHFLLESSSASSQECHIPE
jgi:hypothetical protein